MGFKRLIHFIVILLKQSTSPCNLSLDDEFDSTTPLVSHLSSHRCKRIFDEIDVEDECEPGINNFDEPEITVGDSLSVSSSSVSACSSKKKVVKTEDDSIPLPDPLSSSEEVQSRSRKRFERRLH